MKEHTREIIFPKYIKHFQCIGSDCEDTCCAGWKVTVDKDTYNKYRNTKQPVIKDLLKENVTRIRSGSTDKAYAKLKMDNSGHCTFLDEDRLCKIQKELGHDYLSNTCAVYPRNFRLVDGVVEKTAVLSCPEVARLVLLNDQGIDFIQDVESSSTKGFIQSNTMSEEQRELFWDLRIFSIKTLQNRTISIENRLIIIGLFLKKYEELDSNNKREKMLDLIQDYEKKICNKSFIESLSQLPSNFSFQIKMSKVLLEYRQANPVASNRYIECFNETIEGLGLDGGCNEEEVIQHYQDAYKTFYQPFFENHAYILENYLVNYVFMNLFPFNKSTVTDSFAMLIVNFSMIKLHLIGMAKYHGKLNTNLIIKLVQSYSKTVDHSASYLKSVENLMKEHGYSTLAHMVVLVRS